MRARWPLSRPAAVAIAAALCAGAGCDVTDNVLPLSDESDAWSPGAAGDGASTCFQANVCREHGDCPTASCNCTGRRVLMTERCVDQCCLSVYAACLRACADAGIAGDAADAASDGPTGF
jgi:hypothetical protein